MEDNEFIKNLEIVEKGVYGRDVRQAIYDLFKYQNALIQSTAGLGNIICVVNPLEVRPYDKTIDYN